MCSPCKPHITTCNRRRTRTCGLCLRSHPNTQPLLNTIIICWQRCLRQPASLLTGCSRSAHCSVPSRAVALCASSLQGPAAARTASDRLCVCVWREGGDEAGNKPQQGAATAAEHVSSSTQDMSRVVFLTCRQHKPAQTTARAAAHQQHSPMSSTGCRANQHSDTPAAMALAMSSTAREAGMRLLSGACCCSRDSSRTVKRPQLGCVD